MSGDFGTAVVGLVGALIGGLATFLGVWWQGSQDSKRRRRDRLAEIADSLIDARWRTSMLQRRVADLKGMASINMETIDKVESELHQVETSFIANANRLHMFASQRMSDASTRILRDMPDVELARTLAAFAVVVRGEVSPSWLERREIRKRDLDAMFAMSEDLP